MHLTRQVSPHHIAPFNSCWRFVLRSFVDRLSAHYVSFIYRFFWRGFTDVDSMSSLGAVNQSKKEEVLPKVDETAKNQPQQQQPITNGALNDESKTASTMNGGQDEKTELVCREVPALLPLKPPPPPLLPMNPLTTLSPSPQPVVATKSAPPPAGAKTRKTANASPVAKDQATGVRSSKEAEEEVPPAEEAPKKRQSVTKKRHSVASSGTILLTNL